MSKDFWEARKRWYVVAANGPHYNLLAGPYQTHGEALAMLDKVRRVAYRISPMTVFYTFSTCRVVGCSKPGLFNRCGLI